MAGLFGCEPGGLGDGDCGLTCRESGLGLGCGTRLATYETPWLLRLMRLHTKSRCGERFSRVEAQGDSAGWVRGALRFAIG